MRLCYLFLLTLVCAHMSSCESGHNSRKKEVAVKTDTSVTIVHSDTLRAPTQQSTPADTTPAGYADDDITLAPAAIKALPGKGDFIAIEGAYSAVKALRKLFPGKYYKVKRLERVMDIVAWKCRDCRRKGLPTDYVGERTKFPYTTNTTLIQETLKYTDDDGNANVIQAFSTTEVTEVDMMFCGRYSCAVLGLARFKQTGGKWVLQEFEPGLGCYGAFQTMPEVKLLKYGRNNYGAYLIYSNGGPGGPYYGSLFAFGSVNGKFELVLSQSGVSLGNSGSDWNAVVGNATGGDGFGDIPVTMEGHYHMRSYYQSDQGDTITNAPKEVQQAAKTADSFNFRIKRVYSFSGKGYKLKKTSMRKRAYSFEGER